MANRAQHLAAHRRHRELARWLVDNPDSTARDVVAAEIFDNTSQVQAAVYRLEFLGYVTRSGWYTARWNVPLMQTAAVLRGIDTSLACTCNVQLDDEKAR